MAALETELREQARAAQAVREQMETEHATTAAAAYHHMAAVCQRFATTAAAFPDPHPTTPQEDAIP